MSETTAAVAAELRADTVFLPYQAALVGDTARVRVVEKSRRIGVSWCVAGEAALYAAEAARKHDVWYVGYNRAMAKEFVLDSAFFADAIAAACKVERDEAGELLAAEYEPEQVYAGGNRKRAVLMYRIDFASGNRITALSSRPTELRNKQGLVVIDEAAFHDDLDGLLKAVLAVLVWGGRVIIISTHNGVRSSFARLVEAVRSGRRDYSIHKITFRDAVAQGLYRRICKVKGEPWSAEAEATWVAEMYAQYADDAAEELDVIPADSAGQYLGRATVERCMKPAPVVRLTLEAGFEFEPVEARTKHVDAWCRTNLAPLLGQLDPTALHALGQDFGRKAHLTVFAPVVLLQDLRRRVPFLVELRRVPFEQQRQVLFYVLDNLPRLFAAALDATGNGSYLAEVAAQRYGERLAERDPKKPQGLIERVTLRDVWYALHMPKLKRAFEDGLIEVPHDADVLEDLCLFETINGTPRLPKTTTEDEEGERRHGDAGVAILLAHYASGLPIWHSAYKTAPVNVPTRPVKNNRAGFRTTRGGLL